MTAVAVKLTYVPRTVHVARSLLLRGVVPSVQLLTVAMPEAFVVAEPPVTEPPPDLTENVTEAPGQGL